MPDVQFDELRPDLYSFRSRSVLGNPMTPRMARWLMKLGIAKTERAAGLIMVVLMVLFFAASAYFFLTTG